jgi:hypothetical protein
MPRIATRMKALKADPPELGSRGNSRQATMDNDTRAAAVDETVRLGGGDKP